MHTALQLLAIVRYQSLHPLSGTPYYSIQPVMLSPRFWPQPRSFFLGLSLEVLALAWSRSRCLFM